MRVGNHARKRRVGEFAKEVVVIHADDGHFIRDSDAGAPAGVEHLLAPEVVAGHDPDRPGQRLNPLRQIVHLFLVIQRESFCGSIKETLPLRGANTMLEMLTSPI